MVLQAYEFVVKMAATPVRICLVYDCLYPHTIGGAERWYRNLAEQLVAAGHEVTYLTLRQWESGADPDVPGVDVMPVGPRVGLYGRGGRRRIAPPILFGAGVLRHLVRHGGRYDVVHSGAMPFFSPLAVACGRVVHRYRVVIDWHEIWTPAYWREYLGPLGGRVGWAVQRLCARTAHDAICFSRMHAERLRELGFRGPITVLAGLYSGPLDLPEAGPAEALVVYAGRHIPEKRVPALVPAIARAREAVPGLRGAIFGDGPERATVLDLVARHGLGAAVDAPGFVDAAQVEHTFGRALCLVQPSRREGYGLVVVEAAAHGTPSVVVADPDNAATELVVDGENGFVAPSAEPDDLAAAIVRVHTEGAALRASTRAWFERNAERLSLDNSLEAVLAAYGSH